MKICYFNLVEKIHTRDAVYLNGLKRLGVEITECRDWSPGFKKFWNLYKKHKALKNDYDVLMVGFSGHILVPFARLISRKKVVFNALSSLYDGIILSRKKYGFLGVRVPYVWMIDWLAFHSADLSLVDTDARKKYIMHKFFVPEHKLARLWSGVDDSIFVYDPNIKKLPVFTVLFRGALMPESGIEYMLQAAEMLKPQIRFRIIGSGYLAPLVDKMIKELGLENVEWFKERLPWNELAVKMQECHISLGQLSDHPRQEFHIPFKTLESMALKIPYLVTLNSYGIFEFLTDKETRIGVEPANAKDLAEKILWAKNNQDRLVDMAENAYGLFRQKFTTEALAKELITIITKL